jgi:HSP20 family protein
MRYWDVFKELENMRRDLDRVFTSQETWRWPFSKMAFLPGLGARQYPMINISEDKDNVYVEALSPGVNPETLDVSITDDVVTISGEKLAAGDGLDPEAYHRCERAAGKFVRTIEMNTKVEENKVKADYKNGLLSIILPKAESAKPKRVAITAGN